jgi:hypothetical protein
MRSGQATLFLLASVSLGCGRAALGPEPSAVVEEVAEEKETGAVAEVEAGFSGPADSVPGAERSEPAQAASFDVSIVRRGAFGFCAQEGMVLRGGVSLSERLLQGTRAVAGDPTQETCLDPAMAHYWSICMVEQEFPAVGLSPVQLAVLRARVNAVPEYACEPYRGIVCDPCMVTTITVGDRVLTDNCCGTTRPNYQRAFSRLASYLDELASGAH